MHEAKNIKDLILDFWDSLEYRKSIIGIKQDITRITVWIKLLQ